MEGGTTLFGGELRVAGDLRYRLHWQLEVHGHYSMRGLDAGTISAALFGGALALHYQQTIGDLAAARGRWAVGWAAPGCAASQEEGSPVRSLNFWAPVAGPLLRCGAGRRLPQSSDLRGRPRGGLRPGCGARQCRWRARTGSGRSVAGCADWRKPGAVSSGEKTMSRPTLWCAIGIPLLFYGCTVSEGDLLQTVRPDLLTPAAPSMPDMLNMPAPPPLCTTVLLSRPDCTQQTDLQVLADQQCTAQGLIQVDLSLMTAGCSASSARSATATCCPFSRPPHCTLEHQHPADQVCRSGPELIALADAACGVTAKRALIYDLLDYCQNGRWLGVLYWCCE